jgi:peptide methionine sulfoxide reductase MsrA
MGVVRKDGKWSLEKDREGVYTICERGDPRARIITDDYEPKGMMDDVQMDVDTEKIEVRDFKDAEREFQSYVERAESGGLGIL